MQDFIYWTDFSDYEVYVHLTLVKIYFVQNYYFVASECDVCLLFVCKLSSRNGSAALRQMILSKRRNHNFVCLLTSFDIM